MSDERDSDRMSDRDLPSEPPRQVSGPVRVYGWTWGPDEGRRPGLPSGGDAPRHPTSSSPSDLFVGRRTSAPTECSPGGQPEPDGVPAVAVSTADATAAAMRS